MRSECVKKAGLAVILMLLCFRLFSVTGEAWEPEDGLSSVLSSLPDAVRSEIPDADEETLTKLSGVKYYVTFIFDTLSEKKTPLLSAFSSALGMMLLLSLAVHIGGERKGIRTVISAAAAVFFYRLSEETFLSVADYLTDTAAFAKTLVPVFTALYAAGGNTAAALSSGGSFTVFLSLVDILAGDLLLPLVRLLFALTLIGEMRTNADFSAFAKSLKKTYTTILVFLSMLFGVTLSAQTLLSSAADTLSARSLKFAVGNMIPVVGGTVGNALGTVAASVGYIRTAAGGVSVATVLLITLPTLLQLFCMRLVFSVAGGIGRLIGAVEGERVAADFSGIYDMLLATVALTAVSLILLITVFAKCAVAVG